MYWETMEVIKITPLLLFHVVETAMAMSYRLLRTNILFLES